MASLKDILGSSATTSQTEAAQRLITAKQQGGLAKQVGQAAPREENLAETAARLETQAGLDLLAQQRQAQQQQTQQAEVETVRKEQAATQQIDQEAMQRTDKINFQTDAVLDEAERKGRSLDFERDRSVLEAATAGLRLQSQKYIAALEQAGQRNRITSMQEAQVAMANEIMAKELEVFNFAMSTEQLLAMDEDEFRRMMTTMQIKDAKKLADKIAADKAEAAKWEGAGMILSGGIKALSGYAERVGKKEEDKKEKN